MDGEKASDTSYSDAEAALRRDEALKRALNMPPLPHKQPTKDHKKEEEPES
jgi:hypothetical protein